MNYESLYLNVKQCAARYNISVRQFQMLVQRGDLPQPIKLGGCSRWPVRLLEEFESEQNNKCMVSFENASKPCKKKRK
jgi:predicted DNA-binding transcriptional regulator AlpA